MRTTFALFVGAISSALAALPTHAHDGHGALSSAHLHGHDTVVLLVVGVLAAAWLWHRSKR